MKREKWNRKTDLRNDPAESVSGAYETEREYTLEEILSEFSGDWDGGAGEQAAWENEALPMSDFELDLFDRYESAVEPAAESGPDNDYAPAAPIMEEESQITAEAVAPEALLTPENTAGPAEAGSEHIEPEALPGEKPKQSGTPEQSGKTEKTGKSGRERKNRRRKQKIVEDFPDMPPEENPAISGDVDYTALFRMFADPEQAENAAAAETEKAADDGEADRRNAGTGSPEPEEEKAHTVTEEPLFAENSPDFRDILREFMLGDQHPIYADMPGIGKKARGAHTASDELADLDAAIRSVIPKAAAITQRREKEAEPEPAPQPQPQPAAGDGAGQTRPDAAPAAERKGKSGRKLHLDLGSRLKSITKPKTKPEPAPAPVSEKKRREYRVEEDFPAEAPQEETQPESEPQESSWELLDDMPEAAEQGRKSPDDAGEDGRETEVAEEAAPTEPEEEAGGDEEQGGRLKKLLHGFGESRSGRKRALNEPKAYASFEDYVPSGETQAETGNPPKTAGAGPAAPDEDGTETVQAPETDDSLDPEADDEILYSGDFPSFGQWILNELMTLWIRLNGIGNRESTATMEDDSEDLGKEVNVANASRYYGSQVTMLRMRFQIGLVLLAILAYLTLGLPVSGMLKTAKVSSAMCLGLQLTIMLLCLDVVTNAAVNLTRRRFGADSLAVLACLISSFDALSVAVGGFGSPHIPLCFFSSLSLMGILFSSLLSARALRKSIRVPAIGKRVYCVTAEEGVRAKGDLTLLKSVRPSAGFVRRAEETPPDESLFSRSALLQLLCALLLSLLTALVKHSMGDYLYILSAILSCAVPVTALLAFALPFFIGSGRIFSSGAAVAGWSGIHDIGCSRNLIVTDRDLFPEETVSIETVRIFADDSAERVIGFAGSMIAASGSGLAPCFAELMQKNNCRMRQVEDFQWLAGGGLQGRIEGSTVLCGSPDLMQLMNVKVPYRLVDKTTVLLAIDGVLYGIFKINYVGLPEIRTALQELIASNRHPIFAIRDFNITPELLHEVFDVATDGYDFPPYGDRFRISEAQPSETSKVSAVICREGLGPLTHLADTGRSMYVAIRMNLIVTAAVAVIGMLLVFVKLIGTGEVSAWLPFVLMLLDAIIVSLISLFMRF